jgi:ADP-heptose:LPS heptosyltransferase
MIAPKRALMIQLRRIGDVLMCTPSIRAFRKRYPGCALDFLTELPEVLTGNLGLNSLIYVDRSRQYDPFYQYKLIKRIRDARYDLVIDFFANPRSAYYSFLSGAPVRLSYGYGHRKWAYNLMPEKPNSPVYAAMDRLNILKSIDIPSDDCSLEFHPDERDRLRAEEILRPVSGRPVATISPVSRRVFNRWPLERYAEIGGMLSSDYGFAPIILAGPGEEAFAERLAGLMSSQKALVPRIDRLGQLGAIFERADLHIGNDNGPKHIAVACGTPTFTIYGPHSHISWTYPDSRRHFHIRPADVSEDCAAADHNCGDTCILNISVGSVREKLGIFIAELRSAAGRSVKAE